MGRSPIPVTQFPDSQTAKEYAKAFAKQTSTMARGKKKKFFGDPFWWVGYKKEWTEILQTQSDPLTRPGLAGPSHNGWGTGGGSFR